jgi:membrane-bound lytic murein transglycosylase A
LPAHARTRCVVVGALAVLWAVAAAAADEPRRPEAKPVTSAITYTPVPFADVPGWDDDDHLAALRAFLKSCGRLLPAARERAGGDALSAACLAAGKIGKPTRASAKAFFEEHFVANAVTHGGPAGLLTGYYEPMIPGSRTPEGVFQTPIYKRPPELASLEEGERGAAGGGGQGHNSRKASEPFATRAEIDQGALKGRDLELLYCADPVDVFFMQIQGSGRVKLTDGSIVRVHYDGKNGHPYTSIGRYLIDKGLLAADKISLGALSRWLKVDPERGRQVMWQNASYVFFRELKSTEAKGPLGALNAPLTSGRSLAVDPAYHSLGLPIYVNAPAAAPLTSFRRLMIAQDVGSAIKGPERGDIYFGSGDAAGRLAGATKRAGAFIVLLPREARLGDAADGAAMRKAQ